MKICEIFTSIQGESTYAGLPCTFIRLSGCNLRCSYCDTKYSYTDGKEMGIDGILKEVRSTGIRLVEITGGEPLIQGSNTIDLINELIESKFYVLVETNGSLSIKDINRNAIIIMDIKTPDSNMSNMNNYSNIDYLKPVDELKFVICSRGDYEWSVNMIKEYKLDKKCKILFSPSYNMLSPSELVGWIIENRLNVRLNLQLQKYIFPHNMRGV